MNPYSIQAQGGAFVPPPSDWRTDPAYGRPEVSVADMVSRNTFISTKAIGKLVQRFRNGPSHA